MLMTEFNTLINNSANPHGKSRELLFLGHHILVENFLRAFELYLIILFTYRYTLSNICYILTENLSTKKMSERPRRTTTGERRITKGAHCILSTAPFALSTIQFVIIPNDRSCLFNVWRILSVRNQCSTNITSLVSNNAKRNF
jgi:hypothetical protein